MKNLTDEQLDLVLKKLLQDSALDSETLDEIADSPKILWNIKREINQEKAKKKSLWNWNFKFLIPALATFALLFAFGMFWLFNFSANQTNEQAYLDLSKQNEIEIVPNEPIKEINQPTEKVANSENKNITKKIETAKKDLAKTISPKKETAKLVEIKSVPKIEKIEKQNQIKVVRQNPTKTVNKEVKTEEYKTDFIALSYLPTPESGQIVRVKVPRAMMVSLGVTNNVSKNQELVNAEVIIGDDGTSRAIRFISDGK